MHVIRNNNWRRNRRLDRKVGKETNTRADDGKHGDVSSTAPLGHAG